MYMDLLKKIIGLRPKLGNTYYHINHFDYKNKEKRYSLANIITVLLFPITAICRST